MVKKKKSQSFSKGGKNMFFWIKKDDYKICKADLYTLKEKNNVWKFY